MAKFIVIKCECGNEQKVFSTPSTNVKCRVCNKIIAIATGGKAAFLGKRIRSAE
ncbi:MAG: 30S ribosomal protein S27e [Candidatus Micrarchaeota archaeon]